MECLITKRHFF